MTSHYGAEAGKIATMVGDAAEQAASTILKPNSSDADGLPVKVTTGGVDNVTVEEGAALDAAALEGEATKFVPVG